MMGFRLLLFLSLAVLASAGLATVLSPFLPFPFFRIFSRCLLGFGLLAAWFFQKKVRKKPFSELGLNGNGKVAQDLLFGITLSLLFSLAITLLALFFEFVLVQYHPPLPRKLMNYFFGSIAIAFFEELFFRGMLLQTLMDDLSTPLSVSLSSLLYSLVHFVRPLFVKPEDLSLFYTESIGLFLFGVLLSYAFLRSRSLYLSMGLHGGFVLFLKLDGILVDRLMREPAWIFGEERLVGGIATWAMLLLIFPCIHHFTKERNGGKAFPQTVTFSK